MPSILVASGKLGRGSAATALQYNQENANDARLDLKLTGFIPLNVRDIKYWACYAPSRKSA
jgi:hypothetical protein